MDLLVPKGYFHQVTDFNHPNQVIGEVIVKNPRYLGYIYGNFKVSWHLETEIGVS